MSRRGPVMPVPAAVRVCAWCGGRVSRRLVVAQLKGDGTTHAETTWWCAEHIGMAVRGNQSRKTFVSTFDFAVFDLDGRQVAQ